MSKKRAIMELYPPDYGQREENAVFGDFECPCCHGRGYTMEYGSSPYHRESKIKCTTCLGSGRLQAQVTVLWKPDETQKVKTSWKEKAH